MHINLFLVPFIIILGLILGKKDTPQNRKWYVVICSIVLVLVAALRSPEWMTNAYDIDTLKYREHFEDSFYMNWRDLWNSAVARYSGFDDDADIGFLILLKIMGFFTHNFYVFSILVDLIFFIPFGKLLIRFCTSMKQIMFAFVFFVSLALIFFIGGARQIFAMGFDLFALLSIIDNKKIRAALFFLIGVTIHFSSILFLIPLLMISVGLKPKLLKLLHLLCFILFPVSLLMPNEIISFMGNAIGMERYAVYGESAIMGGGVTFIILIETLSLFCLIAIKKRDIQNSRTLQIFYVMAPLFTFFAPLIYSNGSMIRISFYYHFFLFILVPQAIECMFEKANRSYAYVALIGALAILTMKSEMVYYFFWQDMGYGY